MKCILLLTFIALCYSHPYTYNSHNYGGDRNVNINADGTIVVTDRDGKRVTITRDAGVGGKKIDIAVSGPNIPTKRIQIDEQRELNNVNLMDEDNGGRKWASDDDSQRDKRSSKDSRKRHSQGDTLVEIIREYEGVVDQQLYEQLLNKVNSAVQAGQLSRSFYEILQSLNQGREGQRQGLWTPQQPRILTQQIQNQGVLGNSLQKSYNYLDFLRRQIIQQELQELQQQQQQHVGYNGVPTVNALGQQQMMPSYVQTMVNPFETVESNVIGTSIEDVVLEVPTIGGRKAIIESVLLEDPQVVTFQNGQGVGRFQGTSGISLNDLLNTQGLQQRGVLVQRMRPYGQQLGQYVQYGQGAQYGQQGLDYGQLIGTYREPMRQYGQQLGRIGPMIPVDLSEIIEDERDILGQQRQIQQQQLLQGQQKQLLQQGLQQQWQGQQQQVQQQLQQQQLLQQLQHQKNNIWEQYLLNGGSIQGGAQQGGLWQQQLGVNPEGQLYGGYIRQGQGQVMPIKQRYNSNVPLVL